MAVPTPEQVLAALTRRWTNSQALAGKLKAETSQVLRILKKLQEQGLVESQKVKARLEWRLASGEAQRLRRIKTESKAFEEEQKTPDNVKEDLHKIGSDLYQLLAKGEFPQIQLPSRSITNIQFDRQLGQYVLAGKTVARSSRNVGQIRSFSQLIWVMRFINELLGASKSSTLRDIYYSSEAFGVKFANQGESDEAITDVEAKLRAPREAFRVFPEERAAIYGDLTVEYVAPPKYVGRQVNLLGNPDGFMIGPYLSSAKFINCKADKVIAIECGGMFTRFVEDGVNETHNAILIHTGGQAPRSARRIIRRLRYELNLPTYLFVDGDPWGCHISQVIISGSAQAAHLRGLATPDAIWLGVWASDIQKYNLPSDALTDTDRKRTQELLRDPRYQSQFWQKELKLFLEHGRKAEQQAFSRFGLSYVTKEYLPAKFAEIQKLKKQGIL
jgi:DNA topoisomerase-6 subunit A